MSNEKRAIIEAIKKANEIEAKNLAIYASLKRIKRES